MGVERKLQRAGLRVRYDRFTVAWNNEKRFQEFLLKQGEALPEGHNRLGRKPTFKQWMSAMEERAKHAVQNPPAAVTVEDTEWAEE